MHHLSKIGICACSASRLRSAGLVAVAALALATTVCAAGTLVPRRMGGRAWRGSGHV